MDEIATSSTSRSTGRARPIVVRLVQLLVAYGVLTVIWSALGLLVDRGPMGALRRFDDRVAEDWAARRTPTGDDVAFYLAHAADVMVKIIATAVLAALFYALWRRWHEVAVLAVSLILEAAVFITVTNIVGRPRPDVVPLEQSPVASSFPSGHVAAAAVYSAVAVVVFWHTRHRLARGAAVLLSIAAPVLVGGARLYQGMHHVSDVVAGALLGFVTVAVVTAIVGRPDRRDGEARSIPAPNGVFVRT